MPKRIQRQNTKGWRKPDGAVYVGRGSKWRNPFTVGTTQVRMPGAENPDADWELEGRLDKPNSDNVPFYHADGRVTRHTVRAATREEIVAIYREMLTGNNVRTKGVFPWNINLDEFLAPLRGHDLMCWCPLDQPCHADVLLELANRKEVGDADPHDQA